MVNLSLTSLKMFLRPVRLRAEMIAGLYQWCYGCLTNYMHPYVVIGIILSR